MRSPKKIRPEIHGISMGPKPRGMLPNMLSKLKSTEIHPQMMSQKDET
jgi:hypothetical protein